MQEEPEFQVYEESKDKMSQTQSRFCNGLGYVSFQTFSPSLITCPVSRESTNFLDNCNQFKFYLSKECLSSIQLIYLSRAFFNQSNFCKSKALF